MYGNYPYLAHAFSYQGFLPAPKNPVFPNMYPPNTVPTPFHGLNMQNYCTPQMAPMMNNPMMGGYPILIELSIPSLVQLGGTKGGMGLQMGLEAVVGAGNLIKAEGSNRETTEVIHGKSNLRLPPWTPVGIAYRPRI